MKLVQSSCSAFICPCISCSSYTSLHLQGFMTSCSMSSLLLQDVIIGGKHADNFRKWDSTLTGVLEDQYGQFLGKTFVHSFLE